MNTLRFLQITQSKSGVVRLLDCSNRNGSDPAYPPIKAGGGGYCKLSTVLAIWITHNYPEKLATSSSQYVSRGQVDEGVGLNAMVGLLHSFGVIATLVYDHDSLIGVIIQ